MSYIYKIREIENKLFLVITTQDLLSTAFIYNMQQC